MRKLLSVIFATILFIPVNAYADCEEDIQTKYNLLYKFDQDSDYTQIYNEVEAEEAAKLEAWKEETVVETSNGSCGWNHVPFTCNQGDKHKDCVPEACWELLAQIKTGLFLENEARDRFINQKIDEECNGTGAYADSSADSGTDTYADSSADSGTIDSMQVTVVGENNEPLIGAAVYVKDNSAIGTSTDLNGQATLKNVPQNSTIEISYLGYETQTSSAQSTLNITMKESSHALDEVVVIGCPMDGGIKTVECKNCKDQDKCRTDKCSGTCVVKECYDPCYKLKGGKCELQSIDGGVYTLINKQCSLTCLSSSGYATDPKDKLKCTRDCTDTIKDKNVKKAEYTKNIDPTKIKCEIIECKGKNHPSDDGQSCVPNQGECTPDQLTKLHAKTGYLLTAQNKCVPQECLEPQYKPEGRGDDRTCVDQVDKPCNVKHAKSAKYEMQKGELVCVVGECDTAQGYTKSADGKSCIRDCLGTIKSKEPLATKAEFDSTGKCIIKKCDKKNGKKYIPSDDGQSCEETERDCNKKTDSKIWPEHATAASYKKNKTGKDAKCVATECESGFDLQGGKCVSVNDSDCDKKPENSKKSHRYYDESTKQTLCLIDECKKGYKPSNDMLSCIPEKALSEEDSKKRLDELKDNAQKMKEREQSTENKLLGAAGIGAVGIGGMNIASALAEQNADEDAEQDMRAYLATFRCDYGQGRNIVGGEKGIQLPGASELIEYTTEYKQLATNLKADKEALGLLPGIEAEVIFDSATTGLYDDVSIGRQRGAFTSLSRALLDENSADAAEWQAMKDKTAKKLKTGLVTAGVGAAASLAGNLVVNHGKGDKSGSILNKYEKKKKPVPDITTPRVPCSNFEGTTGAGYKPNCQCTDTNAYFAENEGKCVSCGTNESLNDQKNGCTCNKGFHRDNNGNCVNDAPNTKCDDFKNNGVTGGTYPNCTCGANATFNKDTQQCECNAGYSNPNGGGQCLLTCAGLTGVDSNTAAQYNVPNCPCEYSGATFDKNSNSCSCPAGQHEDEKTKKCVKDQIVSDIIQDIVNPAQNPDPVPVFTGNFSADTTFTRSAYEISDAQCQEIIKKITEDAEYKKNKDISAKLCISATGHTDTKYFRNTYGENANRQKNQTLSEQRANAMADCISKNIKTLFSKATTGTSQITGQNWKQCNVQTLNKDTPGCRRVEVKISTCQ